MEVEILVEDDVTDKRYQLEDKKRKIAQKIDNATKGKRIQKAIDLYSETKTECEDILDESGNDHERKIFNDIVSQEEAFMFTDSPTKIQEKSDELLDIITGIRWRTPDYLERYFNWLEEEQPKMNDQSSAKSLIEAGRFAIQSKNWDRLKEVNIGLLDLLPSGTKEQMTTKIGF